MCQALLEVGEGSGQQGAPVALGTMRSAAPTVASCFLWTLPRVSLHPSRVSQGSPAPLSPAVVLALSAPSPRAAVAEPTQRLSEPCGVAVFGSFAGRGCPRVMACVLSVAQGQRAGLGCVD